MSLKSNQLLRTIQKNSNDSGPETRLAMLSRVSSGKYYVTFYGEEEESKKPYKKLNNVNIGYNQPLLMQKINGTYVIIGNLV